MSIEVDENNTEIGIKSVDKEKWGLNLIVLSQLCAGKNQSENGKLAHGGP